MNKQEGKSLLQNLRVLYVEDDSFHREQLACYLKRRVLKLYLAENGEDGFTKANEYNPDLIITDLKMPGMTGIEMARKIREQNSVCPIIITSGLSDVDIILEAVDVGITKYVLKPINTDELVDAMEKIAHNVLKEKFITRVKQELLQSDQASLKEMEMQLKNELARFIKENTGKGPRKIHVDFTGNEIEIKVMETLTLFEKKLIENDRNKRLVNYNREVFYQDRKQEIEEMVQKIIQLEVKVKSIVIDSNLDTDQIIVMLI